LSLPFIIWSFRAAAKRTRQHTAFCLPTAALCRRHLAAQCLRSTVFRGAACAACGGSQTAVCSSAVQGPALPSATQTKRMSGRSARVACSKGWVRFHVLRFHVLRFHLLVLVLEGTTHWAVEALHSTMDYGGARCRSSGEHKTTAMRFSGHLERRMA
jgi:hypothetical protein